MRAVSLALLILRVTAAGVAALVVDTIPLDKVRQDRRYVSNLRLWDRITYRDILGYPNGRLRRGLEGLIL